MNNVNELSILDSVVNKAVTVSVKSDFLQEYTGKTNPNAAAFLDRSNWKWTMDDEGKLSVVDKGLQKKPLAKAISSEKAVGIDSMCSTMAAKC